MNHSLMLESCDLAGQRRVRVEPLTPPEHLLAELPASPSVTSLVQITRASIARILQGLDPRLLVVVGPCSIHNVAAALRYAHWIRTMRARFSETLEIVMRVYVEKPRTRLGWKGLINDPDLDGSFRIDRGLRLARHLLLDINELGVPAATEFVDPLTAQYLGDTISWAAIGARTAESQIHRQLASGLSCPVGFKNSTRGDVAIAIDAVLAARVPHHFFSVTQTGAAAIVETAGNRDCHVVLRGGGSPNYHEAAVSAAANALAAEGMPARVMIDCSHGNCLGQHREQLSVGRDVIGQLRAGSPSISGVMIESNLREGSQRRASSATLPEQSVTDPCLDLEDTATLLDGFADALRVAV